MGGCIRTNDASYMADKDVLKHYRGKETKEINQSSRGYSYNIILIHKMCRFMMLNGHFIYL